MQNSNWDWAGRYAEEAEQANIVGVFDSESGSILVSPGLSDDVRSLVQKHEGNYAALDRGQPPAFLELAMPLETEGDPLTEQDPFASTLYRGGSAEAFLRFCFNA